MRLPALTPAVFMTLVGWLAASAPAADPPKYEELLSGLDNPCGVAVQPQAGDVFVSDSAAGRVVRVNPGSQGQSVDVIVGYPLDVYGKGPMYNIGPLGLWFLDKNTLVVGGGDQPDSKELVRVYSVPAPGKKIAFDEVKQSLGPIGPGDDSLMGEGNFYGLAATDKAIFVTSNGDDTKGWVLRMAIEGGKLGPLTPFLKTKVATNVDAPVGITVNADGQLVVGQMGEVNVPGDSLLTFYDPATGKLLAKAATGLSDIADLGYSPKTGKLYCVDFSWVDPSQGGLFRLDVSGQGDALSVVAEKIAALDKPSAMRFAPSGELYVTVFGSPGSDGKKPGKLLRFRGL